MKRTNRNYEKNKKRKSYLANKPLEITRKGLLKQVKDAERTISNYQETKEDQILKIKELSQEVKHWKERAERAEEDAESHLKALDETGKEWNENNLKPLFNKVRELEERISISEKNYQDQSELIKEKDKRLTEKQDEIEWLKQQLVEKTEALRERDEKLAEREEQNEQLKMQIRDFKSKTGLHSANKTLKRKQTNIQEEGEKKVKLEKSQELITSIEVSTNYNN